jgi:hypothetical protein
MLELLFSLMVACLTGSFLLAILVLIDRSE